MLMVTLLSAGNFKISSGDIQTGGNVDFEEEITYGDDRILGAVSIEFEGEDIQFDDDLVFEVEVTGFRWSSDADNSWESADADEISIEDITLLVDGGGSSLR